MKKLTGFFTLILVVVIVAKSQVPNGFNYQFVLRDGDGNVMSNTGVTVKLSLTDISQSSVYYVETHDTATNSLGIVNLVIGEGTVESGSFSEVPWSSGDVHIRVEVLPDGQSSYVFMGIDKLLSVPYALYAADGNTMQWLGSLANPPADPVKNQAYYSTLDKASYIWDGDSWELLAMDGLQGEQGPQGLQGDAGPQGETGEPGTDGISIDWLGELSSAPATPVVNQAYYNTTEGKSYLWNGNSWNLVAVDGEPGAIGPQGPEGPQGLAGVNGSDGISISWLGDLDSPPASPTVNNAYYNTSDKIAYIWNGVDWQILAKDGAVGPQGPQGDIGLQGPAGTNGISIEWLGNLSSAPGTPSVNQAYYNSINKISYIWDGDSWEILAQDGQTGATGPQGPEGPEGPAGTGLTNKGNWVSGTTYDPGDYVFALNSGGTANSMWIVEATTSFTSTIEPRDDSSNWIEFEAPEGPAGTNGISVEWLGTYTVAPSSPSTNQAYYNSADGKAYIWDGDSWEVLAQDGVQGPEGPLVSGTTGQTLRHNGTSWIANSLLYNNGTNIGINTTAPSQQIDINGNVRMRGLLYDYNNTSGTSGQFLTRGASGVLWQTPSWTTGTGSSGQMAMWNGSSTLTNLPNLTFSNSLVVVGNPTADPDDPIFEVKNSNGDVIFGVYQEGVRINIGDETITKGVKGGFAVGGLTNQTKASPVEYLRITPDSARIYINQNATTKGVKGGFAVGGLTNQTKTVVSQDLLFINPDSARIYLNDAVTKGVKGGFAVGGLTNQTKTGSAQLIQLTKDNYLIGYEAGASIVNGLYNSFLGYQAGKYDVDGSWNTFLGYQSGMNNTGSDNTFIGYQAGLVHQSKGGNVYIGSKAGANAQNGERNVLIGESAGYGITTGLKNVYIGFESGYSSTSGNYNVFLGTTTGRSNTTGSSNVFVGIGSGYNNISGSNNLFLGTSSGLSNTTGSYNTFLGYETGYSNNSSYNSFVGYQSGRYNTDGQYNTFLGYRSGYTNSSGAKNIFIGYLAGYANTTASNNVFIGNLSGRYNTTGTNNMFLGNQAGQANTTGYSNVLIGNQSGYSNTSGSSNIMIGDLAGRSNQTGYNNVILGQAAGYTGTQLKYNVFIGDSTGFEQNNVNASKNVFIGYTAGKKNQSYNNVFIGNQAGYNNISGQNNIAIGDKAGYQNLTSQNIFIGASAGENNTDGYFNIMVGRWTGKKNTTGAQQILIGGGAGGSLTTGGENVIIGTNAGASNVTGTGNVYVGTSAGWSNTGSKNIFIGYKMGYGTFQTVSNALVIGTDVSGSSPLLYGEFDNQKLKINGSLGVLADPNSSYGVYIDKSSTAGSGYGLYAAAGYRGVYGYVNSSGTGYRYGLYGYAAGGEYNRGLYCYAPTTSGNYAGYFNGNVFVTGAITESSDKRLKENIAPLQGSLAKLLKINGVTYTWKNEKDIKINVSDGKLDEEVESKYNFSEGKQVGVIAQEVEKYFPELVVEDENGYKSVNYVKLVPVLIEAIKEQQKIINGQDEKIEDMQKQLDDIEKLLKKSLKRNR